MGWEATAPSMTAAFRDLVPSRRPEADPIDRAVAELYDVEEARALAYVELFSEPELAEQRAAAARLVARETNTLALEAYATATLALAQLLAGKIAVGEETLDQAEGLDLRLGDPRVSWLVSDARALALLSRGHPEEALIELIRLMIAAPDGRPARDCFGSIVVLARVHTALGHVDEALGAAYRALSVARRTGSVVLRVHAMSLLGARQLDAYNLDGARLLLEQAVRGATRSGSRRLISAAAIDLIRTYAAAGQAERALAVARGQLVPNVSPEAPSTAEAEALALAAVLNARSAEAQTWLAAAAEPADLSGRVVRARIGGAIALLEGRLTEAVQHGLAIEDQLDAAGPSVEVQALLALMADAWGARQDRRAAAAYRVRASAMLVELETRAAHARKVSRDFEEGLTQANPVCCEMAETPGACAA